MFKIPRNSLIAKTGLLVILVVLMQGLFIMLVVNVANIPGVLENFSYDIFSSTVSNRKNYLTSEIINNWADIQTYSDRAGDAYDLAIPDEDGDISLSFLDSSTGIILDMLKKTGTTGGFIILDDSDSPDVSNSALYISNSNYASAVDENSVLQMVAGPSEISKEHEISLSNSWTYGLKIDEERRKIIDNPLLATELTDDSQYWGYWTIITSFSNSQARIVTYTIPIVDKNGESVGIIGIELIQDFLYKSLPTDELGGTRSYGYTLVTCANSYDTITPQMSQGTVQQSLFTVGEPLPLEPLDVEYTASDFEPHQIKTELADVAVFYEKLDIYASNTPFEDDSLYLMGMTAVSNITSFSDNLSSLLRKMMAISVLIGIIVAYFIGYRFSKPIVDLSMRVAEQKTGKAVTFKPTNIREIDQLSSAIVELNRDIFNAAYKMDNVLNQLNIKVGTFEYKEGNDMVMTSGQLRKILGLSTTDIYDINIEKDIFFEHFEKLKLHPVEEYPDTFLTSNEPEEWCRIVETDQDGVKSGVVIDVTKDMLETRALNYQRDYDTLTGIYNRAAFHRKAMSIFSKTPLKVSAFVMFDLDNLKYVNDTYGHGLGDTYIKSAAEILSTCLGDRTLVGRMSGDEFYVFLYGFDDREEIMTLLNSVYKKLDASPILLPDAGEFKIRMSGGIAWYQKDSSDFEELIRYADFAMYEGKVSLKGELREFNKNTYLEKSFMLRGKEELNRILDNQFIDFAFQPIVDARTGAIYAYEALMRPQSEILNTPLKLLQISTAQSQLWKVEKITFFKSLSLYVKHREMFSDAKLFINSIPNKSLRDDEFGDFERMYGEHLKNIVVEIIETEQQSDDNLTKKLDRFNSWGSMVALDDYGSGYNSDLGLLSIHPDIVKLDRSLIANVETDSSRQAMVKKIIGFCREQNIMVLAEGVETYEQMAYLLKMDVDYLQGYYICRPAPLPNFDNEKIMKEIIDIHQS